jgi:hypothetical protein
MRKIYDILILRLDLTSLWQLRFAIHFAPPSGLQVDYG